jgi:hypothetical protein
MSAHNNPSAWELLKNTNQTNNESWLNETPLLSYGVVTRVLDNQTVEVEAVVQATYAKEAYTVSLLSLSSPLFELAIQPQVDDLVLLLFLQRAHPDMFDKPAERGDEKTVYDPTATGYNRFSGVGILARTMKAASAVSFSMSESENGPEAYARVSADVNAVFTRPMSVLFDNPPLENDNPPDAPAQFIYGKHAPYTEEHWSKTRREYGRRELPDKTLDDTVDAPVEEEFSPYAPIRKNIQGRQDYVVGIGTDPDGDPEGHSVETDAPINITTHGKAPVSADIRGSQTIKIGIGNDESENLTEDREAPVSIALGEKAPITLNSKSGLTLQFNKAILLKSGEGYTLDVTGLVKIQSTGKIELTTTGIIPLKIGNTLGTLGGFIVELLSALATVKVDPLTHTGAEWAASQIAPLALKWPGVFE